MKLRRATCWKSGNPFYHHVFCAFADWIGWYVSVMPPYFTIGFNKAVSASIWWLRSRQTLKQIETKRKKGAAAIVGMPDDHSFITIEALCRRNRLGSS
jgi:hypothetical protein